MRRSTMLAAAASVIGLGLTVAGAQPPPANSQPAGAIAQPAPPVRPSYYNSARRVAPDSKEEALLERELTMQSRGNSDVDEILKVAAPAPALPKPTGKVVRVASTEEYKKALETVEHGTTILLADGVYRTGSLLLQDRERITIRSESGDREKVVFEGEGTGIPSKRHHALALHGTPEVTIADVTFRNFDYGVYIYGDGGVIRPLIHNVKFHNIWIRGVKGTHARRVWDDGSRRSMLSLEQTEKVRPRDGRIQYCLFVCDRPKGDIDDEFNGDYISGIDMMWLKNWTISDNVFVGIRGHNGGGRGGIFVWVNSEDVVAERNIFVNCDRGIAFGNPSGEGPHMTRGIARNNFVVAGARQAIEFHQTVDSIACNNTVYGRDLRYERTIEFQNGNRNARFMNNLVHGRMFLEDGVGQECNIVGDLSGWFVKPEVGDLHLTDKAKEARDKAVPLAEVRDDFDMRRRRDTPDVGADEAGAHRRASRTWPKSSPENPDVAAVLRIAPKAPALPAPAGKVVRVRTIEEFHQALKTVENGTTILLADGVYRTGSMLLQDREKITIRGESGDREKVIFDGEGMAVAGKRHWALALHGTPDFVIADMTMRNFDYGVYIFGDGNVQRPVIHNMKFQNIWVRGVKGTHAQRVWDHGMDNVLSAEQTEKVRPHDGRIEYCLFVNERIKENTNDGFGGNYVSGIDMMWLRDWVIRDNVFIGIRGATGAGRGAIFTWVKSENVIAERNIIVNCDRGICFGNPFYIKGEEPHMKNGVARNNFIVCGARQGIEFHRTEGCMAYNNSIYGRDMQYEDTVEFGTRTIGAKFCNNLVHGRTNLEEGTQQEANIVGNLAGWFREPSVGDLHLTDKAREAVGKARPLPEVTEDFDRKPRLGRPCIGADERDAHQIGTLP